MLPYTLTGGTGVTIYTYRWDGCYHIHLPVGRVLPYTLTGGTGVADGTGASTAPGGVAVFGVGHRTRGGKTLVDDSVTVVTHLTHHRVTALEIV